MKKILIILCFIATNVSVQAQWKNSLKAGIKGGYEWNAFKNPQVLDQKGAVLRRDTLWTSGFFQGFFLKAGLKKNMGNQKFKLGLEASGTSLNTTTDADRHAFGLEASYRVRYAKRKYFEISPGLYRVKRSGVDQTEAVLRMPFSYLRLTLPLHIDFYLGKKTWLKTHIGYTFKDYDRSMPEERLYYHAGSASLKLSKKWENTERTTKVVWTTSADLRKYTDIGLQAGISGDPGLTDRPRTWRYYRTTLEYRTDLKEHNGTWALGLYGTLRQDPANKNGYQEFGPGISWSRQWNKLLISGSARYLFRAYSNLTLDDRGTLLEYRYIRAKIKAELALTQHLKWFVKGHLTDRRSNNPFIVSLSFREYSYALMETGIGVKL